MRPRLIAGQVRRGPGLAALPQLAPEFRGGDRTGRAFRALLVEPAANRRHVRRGRAVQRRLRALGHGKHPPGQDRAHRPRHPPPDVRRHHARVQRVGGDPGPGRPPGEFLGEQHVAQFGDRVLTKTRDPARRTPQRVEVDALGLVVGVARHVHYPRGCAGLKQPEQGVRQQEMPEVVDPEHQLEPLLGHPARPAQARVVDQDVQRLPARQELGRARPDGIQVGQVQREHPDRIVPGRGPDIRSRLLAPSRRPARDINPPAPLGQPQSRGPADPGIPPRNEKRPPPSSPSLINQPFQPEPWAATPVATG